MDSNQTTLSNTNFKSTLQLISQNNSECITYYFIHHKQHRIDSPTPNPTLISRTPQFHSHQIHSSSHNVPHAQTDCLSHQPQFPPERRIALCITQFHLHYKERRRVRCENDRFENWIPKGRAISAIFFTRGSLNTSYSCRVCIPSHN